MKEKMADPSTKRIFKVVLALAIIMVVALFFATQNGTNNAISGNAPKEVTKNKNEINTSRTVDKIGDKPASSKIEDADYYVSTSGNDDNPGTEEKPFRTWQKAFDTARPGDLVYIRGGIYPAAPTKDGRVTSGVYVEGKSGTEKEPIRIFAYPGETPILDGKSITQDGLHAGIRLEDSNYWHIKGLTVRNVPANEAVAWGAIGFYLQGSDNNIIENVASYGNSGPGFAINGDNNLFLNCDSYNNYDELVGGENADGFIIGHEDSRYTNKFVGSRAFNNSDDGFDTYGYEGTAIYENSWAFGNGYGKSGDGAGFKLGKADQSALDGPQRILRNCIVANTKGDGFDQSDSDEITVEISNSIAYNVGSVGFLFTNGGNVPSVFKNNIAYKNKYNNGFQSKNIQVGNSWQMSEELKDSDFISLDGNELSRPRKADGSLPDINFLKLKSGSEFAGIMNG